MILALGLDSFTQSPPDVAVVAPNVDLGHAILPDEKARAQPCGRRDSQCQPWRAHALVGQAHGGHRYVTESAESRSGPRWGRRIHRQPPPEGVPLRRPTGAGPLRDPSHCIESKYGELHARKTGFAGRDRQPVTLKNPTWKVRPRKEARNV